MLSLLEGPSVLEYKPMDSQQKKEIAIESNHERLLNHHLQHWYRFSQSRGKRINMMNVVWRGWKAALIQHRTDLSMLKKARRTLQTVRSNRSLMKWKNAMRLSLILHAYQLRHIVQYIEKSPYLYLPPTFVHQSDRLLLIQYWKLVSKCLLLMD